MTLHDKPADRAAVRGGWREFLVVLMGSVALTAAMTYPLALRPGQIGRADSGDGQFSIWNVAWVARTLVVDPLHVFDANIFFPRRGTLAYSEANLGAGALAIPAYWATRSPYVANNVVTLLSFIFSGLGMYYLVRYLTRDRRAAAVSAICFAYCPYVFAHFPHIQLMLTAGLPWSMLAFHRFVDRPSAGRGAVLGLAMGAQAVLCAYYGIFVMLMVGFGVVLVTASRRRWTDARYWTAMALAAGLAIAVVWPLFLPYLRLQQTTGFVRSLDAGRQFSADWRSYLASSSHAHAWMLRLLGHWKEVAFPGFVATAFGVAGAAGAWSDRGRRRELALLYGGLAMLACWASFGPGGGLYTAMYYTVPGFTLLRASQRFVIVVAFALAVLTGIAVARLLSRVSRPRLLGVVPAFAVTAELFVSYPYRPVPALEPAYRVLATMPRGPVLEMPVYSRRLQFVRSRYMLSSTAHWMPLIDAYSDYIPPDFNSSLDALGDFPNLDAFALLKPMGARYAVFHIDQYDPPARARLREQLVRFVAYLRLKYIDDHIWLYEIVGFPD